jgi:hypothetical protein
LDGNKNIAKYIKFNQQNYIFAVESAKKEHPTLIDPNNMIRLELHKKEKITRWD